MGKTRKYKDIEFFAENGVIYIGNVEKQASITEESSIEEKNRAFKGLPPKEFIKRAINAGLFEAGLWDNYPSELRKVKQFLQDAQEVFEEAKKQGAIDDPKADAWKQRHTPYRKPQVFFPDINSSKVLLDGNGKPLFTKAKNYKEILLGD